MYTRRCLLLGLVAAGVLPAQGSQPAVQITGAVKEALALTADDLAKMPRASVKSTNGGMETVYDGVWLPEVLKKAGVPQGSELRGKALSSYVIAGEEGRFRLVVPKDKPAARSVRKLTKIEVVQVRK